MMARPIAPPGLGATIGSVPLAVTDPVAFMNTYRSYITMIVDPTIKDESKLKALQEVSQELENIASNPQYPSFLDLALKVFIKILQDGEPHFVDIAISGYVKTIYRDLPNRLNSIFDPRPIPKLKDINVCTLNPILDELCTVTLVHCDRRGSDASPDQQAQCFLKF
ncbi:hypothetical protein CEXT_37351 [Caerostris extrusa]|uniref:Uncharacterized protein n=1 Tax=Caerostris extrusa TaxID=172846 RepID=A0AAV4RRJ8_CAEEX|nr:hypothetical protein CEXT_37351 [Caerostris extrusa]